MAHQKFDITKINSFTTILSVVLLTFMFCVNGYNNSIELTAYTPLQELIDSFVKHNQILALSLNGIAVIMGAVMLGRLGVQQSIYLNRCYLAAIFFVILSMSMNTGASLLRVYISTLAIIFAINHIFKSRNVKRVDGYQWFVCGFWLAIASLLYSGAIISIFTILIGMMLFRMNAPREYLSALGGFLMVMVITWSIYIICNVNITQIIHKYHTFILIPSLPQFDIKEWIFIGLTIIIIVLSIIAMITITLKGRADLVKGVLFFIITMFICGIPAVFTPLASQQGLPIMAAVTSMIMPTYFAGIKRRLTIKNFIFFTYLASALSLIIS